MMMAVHPSLRSRKVQCAKPRGVRMILSRDEVVAEWLRRRAYAILLILTAIVALIGSVPRTGFTLRFGIIDRCRGDRKSESPNPGSRPRRRDGRAVACICTDAADLAAHQEALLRSERLAAVGTFVAGIVHDIKNVLAGLGNYLTFRSAVSRMIQSETSDWPDETRSINWIC